MKKIIIFSMIMIMMLLTVGCMSKNEIEKMVFENFLQQKALNNLPETPLL